MAAEKRQQQRTLIFVGGALAVGLVVLGRDWWQAVSAPKRRRDPDKPWEGVEPDF